MNPKIFGGAIIFLVVAIAAGSIIHFWPAKPKELPNYVATRTVNSPIVAAKVIPNPSPPAAPVVQSQRQQTPPVVTPAAESKTVAPAVDASAATQTDVTTQRLKERAQAIEQITSALTNRIAQLAKFTAECETKLAANDAKLPNFGPADRVILKHNNDSARKTIENNLKTQANNLNGFQLVLTAYAARPQEDVQPTIEKITNYFAKLDKIHNEITGIFASLDKDFTPDPH